MLRIWPKTNGWGKAMEAVRVELDGVVSSFRYPFIMIGRQLSYPVPPPATIYGHICSAVGDFIPPEEIKVAYSFQISGKVNDLEHLYIASPTTKKIKGWDYPAVLNCGEQTQPGLREMLFQPKLVLYLHCEDPEFLLTALREPKYMVTLGRSQDLAVYRRVDKVNLVEGEEGYSDGGLLSLECRFHTTAGTVYRLPRYIDPLNRWQVRWGDYLYSPYRLTWGKGKAGPGHISRASQEKLWLDPESPEVHGRRRVVFWHTFID